MFDSQVKRIHEYKRQLLNALRIVVLYNRLRENPSLDMPRAHLFLRGQGRSRLPTREAHHQIHQQPRRHHRCDPAVKGRLQVLFLPDYRVSLAERLIPASDVSNQISTAGYEASGTSNMKFMMNGALTIGTRDGATIEMAEEAGEENLFLFGLTAQQVADSRGWYDPHWHYETRTGDPRRPRLDLLRLLQPAMSLAFSLLCAIRFSPNGDFYMHLADLKSYLEADERLCNLCTDPDAWARKSILNVASSGNFSSDRTIAQYSSDIWKVAPCPVP